MTQTESLQAIIGEAYLSLREGKLETAQEMFDEALKLDYENEELLFAMKCSEWWKNVMMNITKYSTPFDIAQYIVDKWKAFCIFVSSSGQRFDQTVSAFKQFALGKAYNYYYGLTSNGEVTDSEVGLRLGIVSKGLGNYEQALQYLKAILEVKRDDPQVLAELADVYELLGEPRLSKALFREAFFINPQKIDLDFLESDTVLLLRQKVIDLEKSGIEIAEWIPIYGELNGIFSVKRELKPVEASKLKQSIYEMETELSSDEKRKPILVPRLINRYFWLISHYLNKKEHKSEIDELLLKIKILDPGVYKQYIA